MPLAPIHKEIDKTPWVKVGDIKLYYSDKELIETGGWFTWLTDDIIAAASLILKTMYPEMGGLQSPILGESLSFDVCKGEFVQVLNVGRNHWITIYSRGTIDIDGLCTLFIFVYYACIGSIYI